MDLGLLGGLLGGRSGKLRESFFGVFIRKIL